MCSNLGDKEIYLVTFITNILSMITGASTGWSSPIVFKLQNYNTTDDYPFDREATEDEISWIASALNLGSVFGPLLIGKLPDFIGRKNTVAIMSIPYIIAYAILTFSHQIYLYIIARFLVGLIVTGSLTVVPLYMSELCHENNRGIVNGFGIVISATGTIFSYSVGPYASIMTYNLIICCVSIAFLPLFYFTVPETPYYLLLRGEEDAALRNLEKLRGYSGTELQKEFEHIELNTQRRQDGSVLEVFKNPVARKAFLLVTILLCLQQLDGVYLILVFAQSFFQIAGSDLSPEICTILTGFIMLFNGCIVSPTCDRFGRKKLMYVSAVGTFLALNCLAFYFYFKDKGHDVSAFSWLPVVCLILSLIFFGCGVGPVPFVLMGELFPMNVKCVASSLAMTIFSVESFLLTRYFMRISKGLGMSGFLWLFSSMDILIFLFVYFFIFETKGKTLNEIQVTLGSSTYISSL